MKCLVTILKLFTSLFCCCFKGHKQLIIKSRLDFSFEPNFNGPSSSPQVNEKYYSGIGVLGEKRYSAALSRERWLCFG